MVAVDGAHKARSDRPGLQVQRDHPEIVVVQANLEIQDATDIKDNVEVQVNEVKTAGPVDRVRMVMLDDRLNVDCAVIMVDQVIAETRARLDSQLKHAATQAETAILAHLAHLAIAVKVASQVQKARPAHLV